MASLWNIIKTVVENTVTTISSVFEGEPHSIPYRGDQIGRRSLRTADYQYERKSAFERAEDGYAPVENVNAIIQGRQIWQYLADILTESTFRPYIYWTSNGLEFKIESPVVVFTELAQIRGGQRPSTWTDPLERWRLRLLDDNTVERYIREMKRRTLMGPNIIQRKGTVDCYYFDDHVQLCHRLGMDLPTLQTYIVATAHKKT